MVKDVLSVAMVQYQIEWENPKANMAKIEELLSVDLPLVDLIVLPEAFNTGFSMNLSVVAEPVNGDTICWMKRISVEKNAAVCGSIFVCDEGKFFNRFFWVNPDGTVQIYNKRHLFSFGGEDNFFTQGTEQLIVECQGWRIQPQICYDLRFPVWSRNTQQYDLLINVANWPSGREEVRQILAKARAIENQSYTIAVNPIGSDGNNLTYSGNSMLIDARGKVINNMGEGEGVMIANLSYPKLQNFRNKFDTLKDVDRFTLIS